MQTDNEKYNETVQPNTAFLNELKEKLPEFFTRDNSFDLEKFQAALKDLKCQFKLEKSCR